VSPPFSLTVLKYRGSFTKTSIPMTSFYFVYLSPILFSCGLCSMLLLGGLRSRVHKRKRVALYQAQGKRSNVCTQHETSELHQCVSFHCLYMPSYPSFSW
jgi:hypothetical protein